MAERPWDPRFRRLLKIETVDSYQGKENSIVIVVLTRSNRARSTGHVDDPNLCNVALSRAKERLVVIGDARFWRGLEPTVEPMTRVHSWIADQASEGGDVEIVDARTLGRPGHV